MKALLLCAGLGERLRPLTASLPKPLLPVLGRPCVVSLLEWLRDSGIRTVGINTHWLPAPLHAALGDGSRWGLQLHWQHEADLLDGMGTVKSFEWLWGEAPLLVVNGDIVLDGDLLPLVAAHQQAGAALTLGVTPVLGPLKYPVKWDCAGRLRGIRRTNLEDPAGCYAGEFTGLHILEPEVWRRWIPPRRRYHLTIDLLPRLLAAGVPVACHQVAGLWADIGSLDSLDRANVLALHGRARRYLAPAAEQAAGVFAEDGVQVAGEVRPPVYLGAGCQIADGAVVGPYSIVAPGVTVAAGTRQSHGVVR
ncbi:MAG: NDP-sugar synthase [Fimbriimonadaceae bacterium]|nr:NDP-sugar synthase [Fimbriimonadaceae bacterium]